MEIFYKIKLFFSNSKMSNIQIEEDAFNALVQVSEMEQEMDHVSTSKF